MVKHKVDGWTGKVTWISDFGYYVDVEKLTPDSTKGDVTVVSVEDIETLEGDPYGNVDMTPDSTGKTTEDVNDR